MTVTTFHAEARHQRIHSGRELPYLSLSDAYPAARATDGVNGVLPVHHGQVRRDPT